MARQRDVDALSFLETAFVTDSELTHLDNVLSARATASASARCRPMRDRVRLPKRSEIAFLRWWRNPIDCGSNIKVKGDAMTE